MFKHMLAAAVAAALIAAPVVPAYAQAAAEKTQSKTDKKPAKAAKTLTPQQQKMACGAKWQDYKKAHNVKGRAEYQQFHKTCLKG
jgi:hypothetical protein